MRYLSLFSGIEAASVAWAPLGWQPVAFAEIEPFPCAVLAHRFPDVPNLGDVTRITDEQIAALGAIDIVVGGSPCQDLSIAGKREGLSGKRSSLFFEQVRIFNAARTFCGARFLLWENVPGALSSNGGRDFAVVIGKMAGIELAPPPEGFGNEGLALGANGLAEWGMLDAQWFGLAQRRKRLFVILDAGTWQHRAPILLEPDSLRGDSPPRRETGQSVAPTLASRARGGGLGTDFDCDGGLVVASAVTSKWAKGTGGPAGDECQNLVYAIQSTASRENLKSGPNGSGIAEDVAYTLESTQVQSVAHTLTSRSGIREDGSGRGTPLVPVAFDCMASGSRGFGVGEVAPTLRSMGQVGSHGCGGGQVAVAFEMRGRDEFGNVPECNHPDTASVRAASGGSTRTHVATGMAVRRLTPRECERLQGFPDDWTAITFRNKPAADGPRYKALGNSMAVPVMRWIGEKIEESLGVREAHVSWTEANDCEQVT